MVTPNRPDAICLIALRRKSPFSSGTKRCGSSPPSPEFDFAPIRFIAIASVSCASALIEPNDIAPVTNRDTIALTGSTSSMRDRLAAFDVEQAAQRDERVVLVVAQPLELGELRGVVAAHGVLQRRDRRRVPLVELAGAPPAVLAADRQLSSSARRREAARVARDRLVAELVEPDAADPRRRAGEVLLDQVAIEADRLEDLRAAVALHRRDAHLGHHLEQAFLERVDVRACGVLGPIARARVSSARYGLTAAAP